MPMRAPSEKKLLESFPSLSRESVKLIRELAAAANKPKALRELIEAKVPATASYANSCYNDPYRDGNWRVTLVLHAMDRIMGSSGVEALGPNVGGMDPPPYEYLNTGDSYGTTLIYTRATHTLRVGCWADIAERHPTW